MDIPRVSVFLPLKHLGKCHAVAPRMDIPRVSVFLPLKHLSKCPAVAPRMDTHIPLSGHQRRGGLLRAFVFEYGIVSMSKLWLIGGRLCRSRLREVLCIQQRVVSWSFHGCFSWFSWDTRFDLLVGFAQNFPRKPMAQNCYGFAVDRLPTLPFQESTISAES